MKKRVWLAAFAFCVVLAASACGPENPTSVSSSNEDKKDAENDIAAQGEAIRLVSVDNVEKYITLAEYKGLILDKNVCEVTDAQVDEQIHANLISEKEEITDVNDGVQMGDLVTISYVGCVGRKTLETEDCYDLTVGEGGMLEGFEENLIGMKKGETKTFPLVFPEDFYAEELQGSVVTYKVTLQSFQREPAITDKLVAEKTDSKTLEEYREVVRAALEEEAETTSQDALKSLAWNTVLLNSEVKEYPQADIENAIVEFKKQVMLFNNESGMELEQFVESQGMTMEGFEEQCQQYAESKVKQNLIIQGIMDAEGIRLDDSESQGILDQLLLDFQAASVAELVDTYGQMMIDEAIGLVRIENFIVDNAIFEEIPIDNAEEQLEAESQDID